MQSISNPLKPCDLIRISAETKVEGKLTKTYLTEFKFKLFDEFTIITYKHEKNFTLLVNNTELLKKTIVVEPKWFYSFQHSNVNFTVRIEKDPKLKYKYTLSVNSKLFEEYPDETQAAELFSQLKLENKTKPRRKSSLIIEEGTKSKHISKEKKNKTKANKTKKETNRKQDKKVEQTIDSWDDLDKLEVSPTTPMDLDMDDIFNEKTKESSDSSFDFSDSDSEESLPDLSSVIKSKIMVNHETPVEIKQEPVVKPIPAIKPKDNNENSKSVDEIYFEKAMTKLAQNPDTKDYVIAALSEETKESQTTNPFENKTITSTLSVSTEDIQSFDNLEEQIRRSASPSSLGTPSHSNTAFVQSVNSTNETTGSSSIHSTSVPTPHFRPARRASQPSINTSLPHAGLYNSYTTSSSQSYNNQSLPSSMNMSYTQRSNSFHRSASINSSEGLYALPPQQYIQPSVPQYNSPSVYHNTSNSYYGSPAPSPNVLSNTNYYSPRHAQMNTSYNYSNSYTTPAINRRGSSSTPFSDPYLNQTVQQSVNKAKEANPNLIKEMQAEADNAKQKETQHNSNQNFW